MRYTVFVAVAAMLALILTASARADLFKQCPKASDPDFLTSSTIRCAEIEVPLDYSGTVAGTVKLNVQRIRAHKSRDGALIALAGGPGQAATPFTADFEASLGPGLKNRDLVVFDQRGTGSSALLRCPVVEKPNIPLSKLPAVGESCAKRIGPRRAFFTTRESVEDIESIRRRLGVEKIAIYGVSYGTKVALQYAIRYPNRVELLVLDSVVMPLGPDAMAQSNFKAMPRILRDICVDNGCIGITKDPVADLAKLVERLRTKKLKGYVVDEKGRKLKSEIGQLALISLIYGGDFDPLVRPELPAAVRSALAGDAIPILRLARIARDIENEIGPPQEFSDALFVTTFCEEVEFPWPRTSTFTSRPSYIRAAAQAIPPPSLTPFNWVGAMNAEGDAICYRWQAQAQAPLTSSGPLPDVPVLVLEGANDVRTPLEDGQAVAAMFPRASVLSVPYTGHSVLNGDLTGLGSKKASCSHLALKRFFAGKPVGEPCTGAKPSPTFQTFVLPTGIVPRSLAQVRASRGVKGTRGRTLSALLLTAAYADRRAFEMFMLGSKQNGTGGLRAGSIKFVSGGILKMEDVIYVPGVTVSGRYSLTGRSVFQVGGRSASHGTVVIAKNGAISGRLGGQKIKANVNRVASVASISTIFSRLGRHRVLR